MLHAFRLSPLCLHKNISTCGFYLTEFGCHNLFVISTFSFRARSQTLPGIIGYKKYTNCWQDFQIYCTYLQFTYYDFDLYVWYCKWTKDMILLLHHGQMTRFFFITDVGHDSSKILRAQQTFTSLPQPFVSSQEYLY
jgi:hypothetical protein